MATTNSFEDHNNGSSPTPLSDANVVVCLGNTPDHLFHANVTGGNRPIYEPILDDEMTVPTGGSSPEGVVGNPSDLHTGKAPSPLLVSGDRDKTVAKTLSVDSSSVFGNESLLLSDTEDRGKE